jgi:hypothetical protein
MKMATKFNRTGVREWPQWVANKKRRGPKNTRKIAGVFNVGPLVLVFLSKIDKRKEKKKEGNTLHTQCAYRRGMGRFLRT